MNDERNQDFGDVESHIHITTTGHQINQGNGAVILTIIVALTFLIVVGMLLVFGIAVLSMAADVLAMIVRAM